MAATAAQVERLRRMINELTTDTYSDSDLETAIEGYPILDADGNEPSALVWVASYDLHSVAAELWAEKAAVVSADYNYSADGANLSRQGVYDQYMKLSRFHNARRQPGTIKVVVSPRPVTEWVSNLAEENL
jgi:hypothetical protein